MDQEIQTALSQRDARIDALSESVERLTDSIAADLDRRQGRCQRTAAGGRDFGAVQTGRLCGRGTVDR